LTAEAWAGLTIELEAGRIGGQEDARRYLEATWGIVYESVNGISAQFKRRKVKWETGRRRHAKADAAAQAAFQQISPPR
jgi:transposase